MADDANIIALDDPIKPNDLLGPPSRHGEHGRAIRCELADTVLFF